MSVQSLSLSSASPEPVPARRRAAEPDSGRAAEAFTLPDKAPAQAASAPSARSEPAQAEKQPPVQKSGAKASPAKTNATTQTPAAAKPGEAAPDAEAATSAPPAQQDIGALVSIAGATQAEASANGEPAKDKDTKGVKDKAVSETPAVDPSVLLAMPADGVIVPVAPIIDLSAAIVPGAVAAAAPGAAASATGIAKAGLALPNPTIAASLQGDAAGDAKADAGVSANGENGKAQLAAGGQQSVHAAKTSKDEPAGSAAAPAAPQAEFKPLELLQAPQNPIDLSALAQPRADKMGAAAGLPSPEQAAAGQPTTSHGQTAANALATPLHMVPIEIGMKAMTGSRSFDIRLDPAELGRVDVKLEVSDKGEVSARLVVDRVETLHLLQRDARTLERAFEQAGLKPSDAGVDISLRDPADQSGFRQNRQQDDAPRRTPTTTEAGEDIVASAQPVQTRRLVRLGGVDLSI